MHKHLNSDLRDRVLELMGCRLADYNFEAKRAIQYSFDMGYITANSLATMSQQLLRDPLSAKE